MLSRCWSPLPTLGIIVAVGGLFQPQLSQGRGGEAGAEAFVADDDDAAVRVGQVRDAMRAPRVQSPLEEVPVNAERAAELAIALALLDCT